MNRKVSGFSLTELLVTMAIIGTLISIAVPMYRNMASSGAARAHAANFDNAVSFVSAECAKALLTPNNLSNIYTELNGGAAGAETKFAPGTNNPAFVFNNPNPGAGQIAVNGPVAGSAVPYSCTAGLTPVTVVSGPVAAGATAADYPNGDPSGRTRTIQ